MFYCNACAEKLSWPSSIMKSRGRCELCGDLATCNDRPSSSLPRQKSVLQETLEVNPSSRAQIVTHAVFGLVVGESLQIDVRQQSGLLQSKHIFTAKDLEESHARYNSFHGEP